MDACVDPGDLVDVEKVLDLVQGAYTLLGLMKPLATLL